MNFELFQNTFKNSYWISEFENEIKVLDDETLGHLFTRMKGKEDEFRELDGLYDFARFLYKIIYSEWTGYLSPKLIFLGAKILVLMGLTEEARKITHGFEHDPGCAAWRLASYYRNSADLKRSKDFFDLKSLVKLYLELDDNSDEILTNDLITWIIASLPVQECFEFYEQKKFQISKILPLVVLFEKLINHDIKKATLIINEMNKFENLTEFEQILVNNKRAVLFQLKGDQRQALEYFETASELAKKIKDYFNLSKISFNQGSSYYLLGDYELSLLSYQKAESSYKMIKDITGIGKAYNSLASIYHAVGEYSIAEKYIILSKKIFDSVENEAMKNGINYKYATILYSRGLYEKAVKLLSSFNPSTESILNFEIQLLKINAQFELTRIFNEPELEHLLRISEKLDYNVGKGNLYLYWSKMNILQGNIIEGESKLNLSYKTFQQISFTRGIILTLNLYAFIELMKGKIESAETYCSTSLTYSKNSNLYLEEIESNILLANIFFIKGEINKSINLIDNILFSLNSKQLKNNFYLQALFLKFNYELIQNSQDYSSKSILKKSLLEFIKITKSSGSHFWDQRGRLLEAQEFLLDQDYQNASIIAKEVYNNSETFETRISANEFYIKALIGDLIIKKRNNSNKILNLRLEIESELNSMKKELIGNELILQLLKYEFLEIIYYQVIENTVIVESKINELKELIVNTNLTYFSTEVQKLDLANQKMGNYLSKPNLEIDLFIK